jgi:hypothetical protein
LLLVIGCNVSGRAFTIACINRRRGTQKEKGKVCKTLFGGSIPSRASTFTAAAKAMMAIGPTRFTYYKQDGFEVWGKLYQDSAGAVTWRLRVFSEQDRRIETYEDVTGDPPEGKRTGETQAMRDAIAAWLAPDPAPGNGEQHAPPIAEAKAAFETESRSENELRLNEEERKSLSPRARAYLEYLEQEVSRRKH